MNISNLSNLPKVPQSYLGKFERLASRAQKSAVRRMAKRANRKPDLSKLFESNLHQRLEQAIISDEFKTALQNHGFTSALEVASFKTCTALKQHIREKAQRTNTTLPEPSYRFYEQAKAEALKVYNLVRHTIAVKDPVNQSLRHTTSRVSPALEEVLREGEDNITYANPNSIQSDQSLAAYLKYIYDLATDGINHEGSFALDTRRPDLQNIELSEDNLKKEITTLELVNEVLLGQITSSTDMSDEAAVFDALKNRFYPLALPFDRENAQVRTALAQIGQQSLNEVARRTLPDDYAIDNADFTLVPNYADALNLLGDRASDIWGNEIELLSSLSTEGTVQTTRDLYGGMSLIEISYVSNFCRLTDISFDELCQLCRQYGVKDDLNELKNPGIYGAYFFAYPDEDLNLYEIDSQQEPDFQMQFSHFFSSLAPSTPQFRSMHFMVRLYKRTGISFHELDWLLQIPGACLLNPNNDISYHEDEESAYRSIEDLGFDIIAHYLYYRQQFEVSVDEFVALLWQVNPYYRLDMEEISFLRQLFGNDAPMVREKTIANNILLSAVDQEGNKPLGDVLRRGLKLSKTEWNAIVEQIDPNSEINLNEDTLGRLYRLSQFFPLLSGDILEGLALAKKYDNGILSDLIASPVDPKGNSNISKILRAMDRLISFSQWMKAAELTPKALTRLLTSSEEVTEQLQCTEDVTSWLQELQKTLETHRVKESDFEPFTLWIDMNQTQITIKADQWFSALQNTFGVLDSYGLVLNVERDIIEGAVSDVLTNNDVLPKEEMIPLVDLLVQAQESQYDDLAGQVAKIGDNVKEDVILPMLLWMSKDPYTVLNTLLLWDYPDSSTALGATAQLQQLYDLGRYLSIVASLSLSAIEVALVAEYPQFICPGSPELLEQIFYLQRFKTWQNAEATADTWITYLVLANSEDPPNDLLKAQLSVILALLLDCPEADINSLLDGTVAKTVKDVDYLARQIYLSQDLFLSATELITVLEMNGGTPNAADASGTILSGLYRYDNGSQEQSYRNALAEQVRDALVGIFMSDVVAQDTNLSSFITDTESLYEYLLLDVNVSSAVPTSRLVEACSSLQLYISRALEGLEPGTTFTDKQKFKQEWEIAKQYRIWEANQKLERYPSNYIEPELRYIKSPLFQNFEAALSSGDINDETVQTAIYNYMEELQQVAELTVCGFSKDEVPEESLTFHFVARSNWEQEKYFYRSVVIYLDDERIDDPEAYHKAFEWEPWQEIQISATYPIISEVSVCKAWNRLYFFWLELEETQDKDGGKLYYVRPKYLRTKMNRLMGDVLSPQISGDISTTEGKLKFQSDPPSKVKTYHPTFNNEIIDLSYQIDDNQFLYSMNVSNKSASFFETSKQTSWTNSGIEGFRSILSTDSSLTVGNYGLVPNPSSEDHSIDGAKEFSGRFNHVLPEDSAYLYLYDFYKAPMFRFSYSEEGGFYGSLLFEVKSPIKLYAERYGGEDLSGDFKFQDNNNIQFGFKIIKQGQVLEQIKLDNLINHNYDIKNLGDSLNIYLNKPYDPTLKGSCPLQEGWWNPETQSILILDIEFYIEFKFTEIYDPSANESWLSTDQSNRQTNDFHFSFQLTAQNEHKTQPKAVAFSEEQDLGCESYLYFSQDLNMSPSDSYVSLLYSEAMGELARSFPKPEGQSLISYLFTIVNQSRPEGNVEYFCNQLYSSLQEESQNGCEPETQFHFDGSFGIYGWEIFYHIPSLVASKYIEQGDYDGAKRWFNTIYDPSSSSSWNVLPLKDGVDQSGVDHTGGITDPDEIAIDNPVYYQQATIRQYLEMLLSTGDDAYRQETQETLQQAKRFYVTGKNLFGAELGQELETITVSDWSNPTLGDVTADNFRPPYNQEIRNLYQIFEERLYNLRHWLNIDGEALNIPLLAPPINPRELQLVAQSNRAGKEKTAAEATPAAQTYTFDDILAKAQGYVKNLDGMSMRLQDALEKKDDRELAITIQNENLGGYPTQFEVQKLNIEMAKKGKQIANAQLAQASIELAGEIASVDLITNAVMFAVELSKFAVQKTLVKSKKLSFLVSTSVTSSIPKIAGTSFGGMSPETGFIGQLIGTVIDQLELMEDKEDQQKKQENYQEKFAKTFTIAECSAKVDEARSAVELAELAIETEEKILEDIEGAKGSDENIMEFMSSNDYLTKIEFYEWYIGQLSSTYKASYDATLSFCRLAERVFQEDTDINSTFVRPNWDSKYYGLLAPYSLALDLERMDLAYTQLKVDEQTSEQSFYLSSQRTTNGQTTVLQSLLEHGEAFFELTEEMFDEYYPDQYNRCIQNIRVIFPDLMDSHRDGIPATQSISRRSSQLIGKLFNRESPNNNAKVPHGRLIQISNCRYYSREKDPSKAKMLSNIRVHQSLTLSTAETDTQKQIQPSRRLRTFEGTGVHSTWHLSIPSVVKAIKDKRAEIPHHTMLKENLTEIIFEVSYSSKW